MLIIRLQRVGRKNDPSFRMVLVEKKRAPKSGGYIEVVGFYEPRKKIIKLKKERIEYWLGHGAQLSASAQNMLVEKKIGSFSKINKAKGPKKEALTKKT